MKLRWKELEAIKYSRFGAIAEVKGERKTLQYWDEREKEWLNIPTEYESIEIK